MSAKKILVPQFGNSVIEDNREDGYWVETFHFHKDDRAPGIITSGLVSGVIEFLENPITVATTAGSGKAPSPASVWQKYEIGKFDSPVAVVAVDITKNGLMDLVICHDYGPFMLECDPNGGWVSWLENPGRENLKKGHWEERFIGRWPAMHRVKAGYFTQRTFLEVIAASVVYGPHDKTTPIPIIRFQAPDSAKIREAVEWRRDVIDDQNFTVIHEITPKKFDGPDGLDSMLVASREGTTRLYYEDHVWKRDLIGVGEPKGEDQSPTSESPGSGDHWGTGCVDAGKIGDDPFAYIATLDPFHGTTACVYTKTNRGIKGNQWKRHVLDVYGTPNQLKHTGDGPGHYIVCADFDGDGDDEFLLALFGALDRDETGEAIPPQAGPNPNKGIMYYKALDLEKGLFAKYKIADVSSARIALGNFAGNGTIGFASMSYNVARYYVEPNPKVTIHLNEFAPTVEPQGLKPRITTTVWAGEGLVYLPYPASVTEPLSQSLIEVANYAITIEILPPSYEITLEPKEDGIKVLYGSLSDTQGRRTPFSVPRFTASTTTTQENSMRADDKTGAIVLRFTPVGEETTWSQAADVPVNATFDVSACGLELEPLTFIKAEDLWWGNDDKFKGKDFYNMTGFHFRFEDQTRIAHMQFWTAGQNVNCGVHNHSDCMFLELHVCLSPGTRNGGMSRLKPEYENTPIEEMNDLPEEAFDHLVLNRLDEHGGMWNCDSYGKPVRTPDGVVSYPYHKWQAGCGPAIDIWAALEFNADLLM